MFIMFVICLCAGNFWIWWSSWWLTGIGQITRRDFLQHECVVLSGMHCDDAGHVSLVKHVVTVYDSKEKWTFQLLW